MASLDGEFKHFHESDDDHEPSYADYIPRYPSLENSTLQILVILTYAPKVEFITVTIKKLRGFGGRAQTTVKVQLFEGIAMLDERHALVKKLEGSDMFRQQMGNHMNGGQLPNGGPVGFRRPVSNVQTGLRRREQRRVALDEEVSESFLMHASPQKLAALHVIVQVRKVFFDLPQNEFIYSCIRRE